MGNGNRCSSKIFLKKYQVILVDLSDEILNKAKEEIKNDYRFYGFFDKKEELENIDVILNRIEFTTNYEKLKDVDFIIENTPEKLEFKKMFVKK